MKKIILLILILPLVSLDLLGSAKSTDLDNDNVKFINNYINFVNESTHGLLIVNKLLENYNLELNKYVDLESFKINNYTNDDLPKNVFEDPEKLFFNKLTPFEWYNKCIEESKNLDPSTAKTLNGLAEKIKSQINIINNIRFELDKVTVGVDLSKRDNLAKVYIELEKAAVAFQEFYKVAGQIEKFVAFYYEKNKVTTTEYRSIYDIYTNAKSLVVNIRDKNTTNYKVSYEQFLVKMKTFENDIAQKASYLNKVGLQKSNIAKNAQQISTTALKFMNNEAIPDQYKLYGRFYYYYNIGMLSKFNRYGTGLSSEINYALMGISSELPLVMELPHIFQVIYPKKLEESPTLSPKESFIQSLPISLKERTVTQNKLKIRADGAVIELLFYDNMIIDGDVVSINFNGDWIIEKAELEKQPQSVKLKLNPEGKNYLILHADNVGSRPPNTTAISYKYKGVKRELILKSDYNQSELIEIVTY